MFSGKSALFDRSLEKATSQLLLEVDWESILQICDCIRQGDVAGKYAVSAIRKKVASDNPRVALYALQVLESVVKNCGKDIHNEIATKEFMEFYKDTTQKKTDPVKAKMLELVQVWSHAFRNESGYKIIPDFYNQMKAEGYQFPTLRESDAMFLAEKAPEWMDGEACHRCKAQFTTFNRKHHCRNCGQVFCSKCSAKSSIIPRFGIEKEVRVCDTCHDQLNKAGSDGGGKEGELPAEYLSSPLAKQKQTAPEKSEEEIREEEELQLALALSQSEAEAKEKEKKRLTANYGLYGAANPPTNPASNPAKSAPPQQHVAAPKLDTSDMDPELARYLNRNYWQNKAEVKPASQPAATQPSAPEASIEPKATAASSGANGEASREKVEQENGGSDGGDASGGPPVASDNMEFLRALRSSIQIFVNRMKSDHSRGRSIANDSAVQGLFATISQMHPQLLKCVQEQENLRAYFEDLQDKLARLKDAREALDALREEHSERRRREQEEADRLRQIQMAQKLEVLRQKKLEYLEYQRQLHLQQMAQQEQEMRMRHEHERSMVQLRGMAYNPYAPMYAQHPGEASPHHQPHYGGGPAPMGPGAPGAPGGGGGAYMAHPQQHQQHGMGAPGGMGGPPQQGGGGMGGPHPPQQQGGMGGGPPGGVESGPVTSAMPQSSMGGGGALGGPMGIQSSLGGPMPSMGGGGALGGPMGIQSSLGGPMPSMGGGGGVQTMGGGYMQGQMGVGGPPQGMQPHMQGMGGAPVSMYGGGVVTGGLQAGAGGYQQPPPPQQQPQQQGYPGAGGGYHPGQPYAPQQQQMGGGGGAPQGYEQHHGMQHGMPPGQPPMQGGQGGPQGGPQQYMGGPQGGPQQYGQATEAPGQPEAQLITFD